MGALAWIMIILSVLLLGALAAASIYFYNFAIKRGPKRFMQGDADLPGGGEWQSGVDWLEQTGCELWKIKSHDGLSLSAHYLQAPQPSNKLVILAHGYTATGKSMGRFARFYFEELGFHVLMPDARGHGQSEGAYIGFGWPDRLDYLLWIEKAVEALGPDCQIVLHGISMGGATVLMVSGEELPPQVKVMVEDCGYTSVAEELAYQLRRMFKLPEFPLLPATSLVTKLRASYGFYQASALKQLEKNRLPVLFIHGSEDLFVPTEMVYRLHAACRTEKELYVVEGAGHGTAYGTDEKTYQERVTSFISRFVD